MDWRIERRRQGGSTRVIETKHVTSLPDETIRAISELQSIVQAQHETITDLQNAAHAQAELASRVLDLFRSVSDISERLRHVESVWSAYEDFIRQQAKRA